MNGVTYFTFVINLLFHIRLFHPFVTKCINMESNILSFFVISKNKYWTFPKLTVIHMHACIGLRVQRVCSPRACVCWPLVQGPLVQPAGVIMRPCWMISHLCETCLNFKQPCSPAQNTHNRSCCKTLEATFHFCPTCLFTCLFLY